MCWGLSNEISFKYDDRRHIPFTTRPSSLASVGVSGNESPVAA